MTANGSADDLTVLRQQLAALADFSHRAGRWPLAELRTEATALLRQFMLGDDGALRIACWQPLPNANGLLLAAGAGWPRQQIGELNLALTPKTGEVHVLQTGATVVMDAHIGSGIFLPMPALQREGLQTAAHVAVGDEFAAHAVLSVYGDESYVLSADALNLMQTVAGTLKTAIRYREQEEKVGRVRRNLANARQQINVLGDELQTYTHLVTHDVREPLRTIEKFAGFIHDDYIDVVNEEGAYMLTRTQELVERLYDQLDALVELDRLTRSDMDRGTVDLSAIVEDVRADLHATHPDRHVTWLVDQQLMANGDRYLLRMALTELLNNAWTFTGPLENAQISFGLTRHADKQAFFVRDNGIGFEMTEHYQDYLFVPFRHLHTDESLTGRGMGLAIVRRVIHRHGGTIWAESTSNNGATFYFTLPGIRVEA